MEKACSGSSRCAEGVGFPRCTCNNVDAPHCRCITAFPSPGALLLEWQGVADELTRWDRAELRPLLRFLPKQVVTLAKPGQGREVTWSRSGVGLTLNRDVISDSAAVQQCSRSRAHARHLRCRPGPMLPAHSSESPRSPLTTMTRMAKASTQCHCAVIRSRQLADSPVSCDRQCSPRHCYAEA